ncbi:hypothetical protein JCM6882_009705 [Rhodosporidiobolus microsporus]
MNGSAASTATAAPTVNGNGTVAGGAAKGVDEQAGVVSEGEKKDGCIFCDVTVEKGFRVVESTPELVVFHDRSPGSRVHLLAVPRRHIDNVKTLKPEDAAMLERMKTFGREALLQLGVEEGQQRMGFHIPPFFSVNHLHLHLLSLPLPSLKGRVKYRPAIPSSSSTGVVGEKGVKLKGWSWFAEVNQVINILHAGQRVRRLALNSDSTSPSPSTTPIPPSFFASNPGLGISHPSPSPSPANPPALSSSCSPSDTYFPNSAHASFGRRSVCASCVTSG